MVEDGPQPVLGPQPFTAPPLIVSVRRAIGKGYRCAFFVGSCEHLLLARGTKMVDESADQGGQRSEMRSGLIDETCSRFEAAWQTGQSPRIEDFLPSRSPGKGEETLLALLVQLVGIDLEWRWKTAAMPAQQTTISMWESPDHQNKVGAYQMREAPRAFATARRYSLAGRIPAGPIKPRI